MTHVHIVYAHPSERSFTREVLDGLLRIGFLHHQQIIWDKGRTVLTRTHYWFQHEPCWYVRKKNAPWFGKAGENSTIWVSPSPKFIMGGSNEDKFDHPTQKPVDLMRRPLLNHLKRGELVYEPFLGRGTTLAAAELTDRVCCGIELDPKYVDIAVERWQTLSGKSAVLEATGQTFQQVKNTPGEWKQGSQGYRNRFESAYATRVIQGTIEYGASALLREDNRYRRSLETGWWRRSKHAITGGLSSTDQAGHQHLSYSRVGSTAATAFIRRTWQPASTGDVGDALAHFGFALGAHMGGNVVREFLPDLKRRFLKIR